MMMAPPPMMGATGVDRVAPTLLEEEDDYFLPSDESSVDDAETEDTTSLATGFGIAQDPVDSLDSTYTSMSSLGIIPEQPPSHSDAAAAILEAFFFGVHHDLYCASMKKGGTKESPQQTTKQLQTSRTSSTNNRAANVDELSPRSTIIPTCSCPCSEKSHIFSTTANGKHYLSERTQSMPAMLAYTSSKSDSPKQPKRPSLKRSNSTKAALSSISASSENNNSCRSIDDLTSSKRNVSFTEISVREYDVELSDHPSCSFGPPIQLGWDYEEKESIPVEDYEVTRSPRREVHELVLSYNARKRRLKQCGYKKKDIVAVEKEVDRIKRERMITEFFLPASAIDETLEKIGLYLKQAFRLGRNDKEQPQSAPRCQIHS